MTDRQLIYLGCPYSHDDESVRLDRFAKVTLVASRFIQFGLPIYSPITHSHPMAIVGKLPGDWSFWESYDRIFLSMSKKMIVLKLKGWEKSVGLQNEIKIAKEMGIPIEYIEE